MTPLPLHPPLQFPRARFILGGLAIFDLLLGSLVFFFPKIYLELIQPAAASNPGYMLLRTGTLWLCFGIAETIAWYYVTRVPEVMLVISVIRLIEVPADIVYRLNDPSLNAFGKFDLLLAPIFNLAVGSFLFWRYFKYRREHPPSWQ